MANYLLAIRGVSKSFDGCVVLDDNVRTSLTIFPTTEIIQNSEFQADVSEALPIYQQYWEKLRTGN